MQQPMMPLVSINVNFEPKPRFTAGGIAKVIYNRNASIPVGSIIHIGQVNSCDYGNSYQYYSRKLANGQAHQSGGVGFYASDLAEVASIKAFAFKKGTAFHWFSDENKRKGFTRFPTHDLEKFI